MSVNLNNSTDCCNTDCTNTTVNVPGPQGDAGAAGTNGTNGVDGVNAYSTVKSAIAVPAVGQTINLYVVDHAAFSVDQIVVISGVGHFRIGYKATDGSGSEYLGAVRLGYPDDTGSTGATIAIGTEVSPAGPQGPAGATGDASALLTAKGDLLTRTSTGATTIGVGAATDGKTLFANSALNTGLEWKAINFTDVGGTVNPATHISDKSLPLAKLTGPSDAEGDLAYYNGTSWARLPHGSDGQVLTVSGGVPAWVAAVSSGLSVVAEGDISFTLISSGTIDATAITNALNLSASTCWAGTTSSATITFDSAIGTDRPVVIFTNIDASPLNTSAWVVTSSSATGLVINTQLGSVNSNTKSFRVQVLA